MTKIKTILLPEADDKRIQTIIEKNVNNSQIRLISEYPIHDEWFSDLNIDITTLTSQQLVLWNAFLALKHQVVDGLIVGCVYDSIDVFKVAIKVLNFNKDKILSSCFIAKDKNNYSIWGDCAFNINPNLVVAKSNINEMIKLASWLNLEPINVALLSYGTNQSAKGEQIEFIDQLHHDLQRDGIYISQNIQFDAAMDPQICKNKKIPFHEFNIFWFPNLVAGNIGYKIIQHFTKMQFAGPFILGTDFLVSDLSRGATIEDIELTIKIMSKMILSKS